MMNYRRLEKSITGSVEGKPFSVPRTPSIEKKFAELQEANASAEEVLEFVSTCRKITIAGSNKYLVHNPVTKKYYLNFEGNISKFAIPPSLVTYIENSYDKDIDFMPVIKAWAYLLGNPRISTEMIDFFDTYLSTEYVDSKAAYKLIEEGYNRDEAITMCTYPDIAITVEGLLATYKVAEMVTWEYKVVKNEEGIYETIRDERYAIIPAVIDDITGAILKPESRKLPDFKEELIFTPAIWKNGEKFFSGTKLGYVYKIGEVQKLPKNALRNLRNTSGGGGLYIGGLNYVDGFMNEDRHTLTCFVNPGDIISFQSAGKAFRTDALMPNNVWIEDLKLQGMYHSSEYAKVSSERLADIIKIAVKAGIAVGEEFIAMQAYLTAESEDITVE